MSEMDMLTRAGTDEKKDDGISMPLSLPERAKPILAASHSRTSDEGLSEVNNSSLRTGEPKDNSDVTPSPQQQSFQPDKATRRSSYEGVSEAPVTPSRTKKTMDGSPTPPLSPQRTVDPNKSAPATPTSPSRGTSSGGLSELSKQLRVLQAKNTAQALEIDRLERQLRILADLQGVSVADLRNALKQACEAEAFGELQHRVASLRAELESASLAKHQASSATQEAVHTKRIANLELRVGELEEVEEKHRGEVENLFGKLMEEQENATRLELLNLQLQSENEDLKMKQHDEIAASEEDHSKARMELQKDNTALKNRLMESTMNAKTLTEKLRLADQHRGAIIAETKLRNSQFKARFMVQEDSIRDLEQQLSSLYMAFVLLRDEKDEEDKTRQVLQDNLGNADAEVARQVDVLDNSIRSTGSFNSIVKGVAVPSHNASPVPDSPVVKQSTFRPQTSDEIVLRGVLLIKSSLGLLRKWKKREVILFSSLSHHYLDMAGEGGIELHVGDSRVEPYTKYPFGMLIHAGGRAVIAAAALNERDYKEWMARLTFATTGDTNYLRDRKGPPKNGEAASRNGEQHPPGAIPKVPSLAEQEESDLKRALELSQNEV